MEICFGKKSLVVTKDEDFASLNEINGFPPKVILVKKRKLPNKNN